MRVEDQEDYRLMVEVLESKLVVVSGCYMKVVGRVGCTWVEVQVFHTYLAHCTTVLVDCRVPQVQAGCMRSLKTHHHSICSR